MSPQRALNSSTVSVFFQVLRRFLFGGEKIVTEFFHRGGFLPFALKYQDGDDGKFAVIQIALPERLSRFSVMAGFLGPASRGLPSVGMLASNSLPPAMPLTKP